MTSGPLESTLLAVFIIIPVFKTTGCHVTKQRRCPVAVTRFSRSIIRQNGALRQMQVEKKGLMKQYLPCPSPLLMIRPSHRLMKVALQTSPPKHCIHMAENCSRRARPPLHWLGRWILCYSLHTYITLTVADDTNINFSSWNESTDVGSDR